MRLETSEYGSGDPLVILHGLFGSRDNWHTVATRLADVRRVLTMDLPNHGESPHIDRFDYDLMAEAVRDTLAHFGVEECEMLGHSMGGKAAMRFAQLYPDRLSRLIVADIAPVDYPSHSHVGILKAMRNVDLHSVGSRRDADEQMKHEIPNKAIRAFLLKNLVKSDGGYSWRLNIDAIEASYEKLRGFPSEGDRFAGPCLFLGGERSDYIGSAERDAISSIFPSAEVQVIEGAGHWLHAEKQDEFVARVRDFLPAR
jgi:esterase